MSLEEKESDQKNLMADKDPNNHNILKRACQFWVKENKPELYEALQQVLNIEAKTFNHEVHEALRMAEELVKEKKNASSGTGD